jgi:hypothetical protein
LVLLLEGLLEEGWSGLAILFKEVELAWGLEVP